MRLNPGQVLGPAGVRYPVNQRPCQPPDAKWCSEGPQQANGQDTIPQPCMASSDLDRMPSRTMGLALEGEEGGGRVLTGRGIIWVESSTDTYHAIVYTVRYVSSLDMFLCLPVGSNSFNSSFQNPPVFTLR